ncbi:lytic transglycosylase domain-containing protein [Spirosoma montaniterrae]|uniref:Lytic transglycosylase n=1 Tax=Spirosoma montaniterrae TaxID=1178516 RepID=A0A1P9WSC6_9BACT|nr:lytic transglycosylase domain-containing protein [Spirosoma montaniterrae]AQG78286.1 lytic transglycosylase [Spirosoma montaniterrae]
MKTQTRLLPLLFVLVSSLTLAQTSVPIAPEQLTFADISVRLDPDARRIVQQDINALLANRQYWTAKLDRVSLYFPMIEAILIDEDVPTDFKYLAVQESSLTPDAVSASSAVGYWQFKAETAQSFGLRVDDEIDERKSITASTHGAAKYLKKSNSQFNNWIASLYSYYLGAGGIAKLIPPDWSYAREVALDGRTDRYILRFFAHKIAIESALPTHQNGNRFALIEYPNGGGKTMRTIAEELKVDEFELRKYNRWVQGETVPTDKQYVMAVPVVSNQINDVRQKIVNVDVKKVPDFVQNDVGFPVLKRVTTGMSSKNDPVLYEINGLPGIQAQAGDNAASLARKAKISLSSFLRYNDMSDRDPVLTGDVYYLAKKRKKALVPFHTVRDGETARSISQRYGLRLKKLMRYNRLDRAQKLAVGRVMWLRERRPANKPVEIINSPTAPVYDQTPTPPTRTADVAGGPARPVNGMDNVPRNASERKVYQPKLVGGGVTPNDGTSEPATRPDPVPANRPTQTTSRSEPVSTDGSQRVVIVRDAGNSPTAPANRPSSQPRATDVSARTVPVATTPKPAPEPVERSRYEGPSEQQADGSVTTVGSKAAPRSTAPMVSKADTRPTTPASAPAEPKAEPRVVTPSPTNRSTPAVTTVNKSVMVHTVEAGQTYYSISRLYGLTVDQLLTLNNRTTNDVLEVGDQLKVKAETNQSSASARTSASTPAPANPASGVTYHTVAKGETMFRISKNYGVTIGQIQEWNNLTDVAVKEGQKIKIMKSEK